MLTQIVGICWHYHLTYVDTIIWRMLTQSFDVCGHTFLAYVDTIIWRILTQSFDVCWHNHLTYVDTIIWHMLTEAFDICWHKHLAYLDTNIWHMLTQTFYVGFEIVITQFYKQIVSIKHVTLQWIVVWFQTTIWVCKYVYMYTVTEYLVLLLYSFKIITSVMFNLGNNCCHWIVTGNFI